MYHPQAEFYKPPLDDGPEALATSTARTFPRETPQREKVSHRSFAELKRKDDGMRVNILRFSCAWWSLTFSDASERYCVALVCD